MTTALITHPCFVNHDTGHGHPERADRMRALDNAFAEPAFSTLIREEAPLREDLEAAIIRAHPQNYYDAILAADPGPNGHSRHLDGDTVMSPGSLEAVRRAVGAGLRAVDRVVDKSDAVTNAFCQVRPPGHHAERATAMGFCVFNSVAVSALYAKAHYGLDRVAIVDFDVHHGNGTQDIFWANKDVFFGSTHQMPLYPGSGAVSETGNGNIYNAPLRPGDDGEAFKEAFNSRILVNLEAFKPNLILVSAGFDAHEADPLANLNLVESDFAWATQCLIDVADRFADGRIVSMLEGGYDLVGLANSAAMHVKTLMSV
ncbi:MAG: histone deacetylase family protein [Hyphomicrobiaceae bacterium]